MILRALLRAARTALAITILVCTTLFLATHDAHAVDVMPGDIGGCKEAPMPERPGGGVAGWLDSPPKELPTGDPWADEPTSTIYEHYGWAGLRWDTYDLGCGGSARDPGAAGGNAFGNFIMVAPKAMAASAVAISRWAYEPSGWIGTLDPLVTTVQDRLKDAFFDPWIGLTICALGVLLMWRARRAHMASALTAVGIAFLVLFASAAVFNYPLQAARVADQTVPAVLGPINAGAATGDSGQAGDPVGKVGANLHNVLYQQKMQGLFGDASSPTAEKWGPSLFRATTISWAEDQKTGADRQAMIDFKRTLWTTTLETIKEEDPDAYREITGKRVESRPEAAGIAAFGMLVAVPFPIVSALLIMVAYLIFRLAVMVAPLLGVLAVFPPFLSMALGAVRVVGAALVNVIAFGIGSAVAVAAIVVLLDPDTTLPAPVALILVAVVGVVLWFILKPFRRLTSMVSNADPFKDMTGGMGDRARSVGGFAKRAAITAATGAAGAYFGTLNAMEEVEEREEEREEKRAGTKRAESESRPEPSPEPPMVPVPAPAPTREPNTSWKEWGEFDKGGEEPPVGTPENPRAHGTTVRAALPPADSTPEMRDAEEAELAARAARMAAGPVEPLALPAASTEPVHVVEPEFYRPSESDGLPFSEQAAPPIPMPVEPEVVDGEEVFVMYRPDGEVEMTPAAEAGVDYA